MSFEKPGSVSEKAAAIAKQNPKLPDDLVRRTAEEEVARGESVEGAIDRGFGYYKLHGEDQETMERWKADITQIRDGVHKGRTSGDFSKFLEATQGKFHEGDVKKILGKLSEQTIETGVEMDEEGETLLSIGFWLWKEQGGNWKTGKTELKTIARIVSGSSKIGDALKEHQDPNCIETSFLIRAVAREMGISGEIRTTSRAIVDHRYFETPSGKIMDYWWMRGTAGLALSQEAFKKARPEVSGNSGHDH